MAHGRALRIVAALGPGHRRHLGVEDGAEHLGARADGEGEQPLFKLAHGDADRVGQRDGTFVGTALSIGLGLLGRRAPAGSRRGQL
jgi:hypothetical protein